MSSSFENRLCRLCLCGPGQIVNIFEEKVKLEFSVQDTIEDLIKLKVVRDALYPWLVCSICLEKLNDFRLFKQRCVESQIVYENYFYNGDSQGDDLSAFHVADKESCSCISNHARENAPSDSYATECTNNEDAESVSIWAHRGIREEIIDPVVDIVPKKEIGSPVPHEDIAEANSVPWTVGANDCYEKKKVDVYLDVNNGSTMVFIPDAAYCEGVQLMSKDGHSPETLDPLDITMMREVKSPVPDETVALSDVHSPGEIVSKDQLNEECDDACRHPSKWKTSNATEENECVGEVLYGSIQQTAHTSGVQGNQDAAMKHYREDGVDASDFCDGKSFTTRSILSTHIRTHMEEDTLTCNVCSASFRSRGHLRTHLDLHSVEKPFSCKICSKSFTKTSNLVAHIRTHTGEKPFSCKMCPKSYTQRSNLLTHIRTHTGEKPFSCNTCLQSYTQRSHLIAHIRSHTGEKPFSCKTCSRSFSTNSNLVKHIRTHTGEKPFSCKMCSKSYTQRSNLLVHIRTHTMEKSYSC